MAKVRVLLLFFVLFFAFFSAETSANSATCILLKQQMSAYQNSKTHPTYRRAHRDYERFCNQPEAVEAEPVKSSEEESNQANTATLVPELTEQEKQLAQQKFEAMEAELKAKQEEQSKLTETNTETIEQNNTELTEQKDTTQTVTETPKVTPKAQPKPMPIQWQNEVQDEQTSLLEAMMLPIMMLLGVLVGIFIYVKFVRSRMDEIKEKAQEMSKELVAAGVKAAEKKKSKPSKGTLDPELYFRRARLEVTLPSGQEVMLDSIIASQYGVFVVLGQKQRGAIIGSATLPDWKEQVGEELVSFESPLNIVNQCCHAVGQIISLDTEIEPIVAFNDMAVFKSQFPIAVMHKKKVNTYIQGFKELKYSDEQVDTWLEKIDSYIAARLEQKRLAEEQERQQNLNRHNNSEQVPLMPAQTASESTQQDEGAEHTTQYPEPGSYQDSVAEIAADNQDLHRVEQPEKPVVDHIAELDAILNKAKEFTEKLDNISSSSNTTSSDTDSEQVYDDAQLTKPDALENTNLPPLDEIGNSKQQITEQLRDEFDVNSDEPSLSEFSGKPLAPEQYHTQEESNIAANTIESSENSEVHLPVNEETTSSPESGDEQTQITDPLSPVDNGFTEEHTLKTNDVLPADVSSNFGQECDSPENMVPHSEFKRRAAKRAVDDGMFDYLEHYDDKASEKSEAEEIERSLEDELAQSLAAGKGFLSGLDASDKADIQEENETVLSDTNETGLDPELSVSTEHEIDLTSFNQNEDEVLRDQSSLETKEMDTEQVDASQGGWRAIKAQMDEEPPLNSTNEIDNENLPKSSWRALKEQVDSLEPESSEEESEKKDEQAKPSLFSNLELDPDWAPKPPPEKIFKVKPEDDPDNN